MSHDHHHDHHHAPTNINRTFVLGIFLNTSFVIIEAFYGWQIDSLALLADAGHNLSDVAGLLLAWLGLWATSWQSNARHTYGWKRLSIMASLTNAIILLVAMSVLAYQAINRFSTPVVMDGETMMWVASVGIIINGLTAWLFLKQGGNDLNMRAAFLHMSADTLVSLGVVMSGALVLWAGLDWLDPVISLVIAGVVIAGTWSVFTQSLHLSFDGVPQHLDSHQVKKTLLSINGIESVHDLHIWAMSTQQNALTAHLVIRDGAETDKLLNATHEALAHHFGIHHSTLQLESGDYAQDCDQRQCG